VHEKIFVDALIRTIEKFSAAVVIRPNDQRTIGIPDILGYVKLGDHIRSPPHVWSIAIEAKTLHPLMEDPFHKGRRTGKMLKHAFTGPQVSMLRKMHEAGVDAFGIVRASSDTAFRIHPYDISAKTGNFTHEEMVEFGTEVTRDKGVWNFWGETYGQISSSRHRNNSRD
jgi:hypothetical protein